MKIRHVSMLLAAMLAGGAFAATDIGTNYSPAAETSNSPLRAGEMSTMTGGAPNVATSNSPYGDRTADAGVAHHAPAEGIALVGHEDGRAVTPSSPARR